MAVSDEALRVLIADDHALFRRGLVAVLATEPDILVVAEAQDGEEAVGQCAVLAPDVVLMDVRMPRQSGIVAARAIHSVSPTTRILMLTVSDEETDLYQAIRAGACGYLLKEVSVEGVADAIRAVGNGQSLISPSMAAKLVVEFAALAKRAEKAEAASAPRLTDRESQVLRLVAKGLRNAEIGEQLCISEHTVKNHVRNILEKLQLHSRMEAVIFAVRQHLIQVDDGRP